MFKKFCLVLAIVALPVSFCSAGNVPKYLNFQSILFDDGGNPLPDGPTNLYIKILDANLKTIYEEEQGAEIVSGAVSVLIGSGVAPSDGVPTGGIGVDALAPDGPLYLEVQAEGYPPENIMELASVPYASYSEVAMSVADNAIGSGSIKEKSININHVTDELINEIGNRLVGGSGGTVTVVNKSDFDGYKSELSGVSGAKNVGINSDFTYSSATNVQGVLRDIDFAIKKREEDAKKASVNISVHTADFLNPHKISPAQIGATPASHSIDYSNPHKVNPAQIGAAPESHVADKANPHGVTPAQIGGATKGALDAHVNASNPHSDSVSASALYGPNGKIKDEKIPDNIQRIAPETPSISTVLIGSGGMTQPSNMWQKDPDVNGAGKIECSLDQDKWIVTCILNRQDVEKFSNTFTTCNFDYEVFPTFKVYAKGGVNIKVATTKHLDSGWGGAYCGIIATIELGNLAGAAQGSSIKWAFYRRQIGL